MNPEKNRSATLRIDGAMNIYRAAELKETLLAALPSSGPLEVDLSGVTELDSAGLQLLMLTKIAAQAQACELRLVAPSPAVLDVFDLLNLAAYFGDQLVIPARA